MSIKSCCYNCVLLICGVSVCLCITTDCVSAICCQYTPMCPILPANFSD